MLVTAKACEELSKKGDPRARQILKDFNSNFGTGDYHGEIGDVIYAKTE